MPRNYIVRRIKEAILLFVIGFFLNFFWESVHAIFLYEGISDYSAGSFVRLISYASLIDAICIAFIFLAGCFIFRKVWMKPYDKKQILFTAVIGIIIAVVIEERALISHRWSYTALMPTIFGIGVSPLVQLAITGVLSIIITSRILR
jgi:hypothetical protein